MISPLLDWVDNRLGTAHFVSHAMRKAFPDHWSFLLGELNAYAFFILVATGTFLALFFDPSASVTRYHGPYALLAGVPVSRAYLSALRLSFEVPNGLLIRQVHHWTALIFVGGIVLHLCRIFFTGAFRKPREINWLIGSSLFGLAMLAGFTGYSIPDDLLSGVGLRIADAVVLSIPLVGTRLSTWLLGGAFPSEQMIPRIFVAHVYLIPATIAALIAAHVAIVWRQKHTQFPGPGRTEHNVVGLPLFPNYALKSAALLCGLVAVVFALGALVQINPIWLWGPYSASDVVNPAQPDWYIGWIEGALRLGPPLSLRVFNHSVPSPFWPAVALPALLGALLVLWPWIEAAVTRDRAEHHLLASPPLRTAIGAAGIGFAGTLLLAGGDDVQARYLHAPVETLVAFYRAACLIVPLTAFGITFAIAREVRAHRARPLRIRLRRNVRGGFDEEVIE